MTLGETDRDQLAYELAQSRFDAAERNGFRAEWTPDGTQVRVRDLQTSEETLYDADDLVRAESDREVNDARQPEA
jgi:hypothetical protein